MPYKDKKKTRAWQNTWIKNRRARWLQENGPCYRCGSSDQLEVDHIDPATKISHRVWSWTAIRREEELKKCQVLCYPCHLEKTKAQFRTPVIHGTVTGYKKGCRCEACHQALLLYWRARRSKKN